ncbi:MAG TPA: hypothetical protein VF714_10120, partial [Jatrophihabitans sp.]
FEPIAAWNWSLQSEKAMRAAGSLDDGLAEAELLAELAVVEGGVAARLVEVQAALASSARPAASTDRRETRRVDCTR